MKYRVKRFSWFFKSKKEEPQDFSPIHEKLGNLENKIWEICEKYDYMEITDGFIFNIRLKNNGNLTVNLAEYKWDGETWIQIRDRWEKHTGRKIQDIKKIILDEIGECRRELRGEKYENQGKKFLGEVENLVKKTDLK